MDHLDEFFAQYPDFPYNSGESATTEYRRMRRHFRWGNSEEGDIAKQKFQDALTREFNSLYGQDIGDINSWRRLCHVIDIQPIPETLFVCREAVRATHVNLVDLVELPRRDAGEKVQKYSSVQELSDYTKNTGKYFPKENAHAGGVLKFLLRQILNPSAERENWGGRGRGRGRGRGAG
ncbi:hypothetical protein BD779DRAFT_1122640 [Infundibulicybe gibba]|nr:hypothetical protein BD779DRAFT_1122640 [Infundibulicybe gibba]